MSDQTNEQFNEEQTYEEGEPNEEGEPHGEEEEFGADEAYLLQQNFSDDSSDSIEIEVDPEQERKRLEEEEKRRQEAEKKRLEEEEKKMLEDKFKPNNESSRRLVSDFRTIVHSNTEELGFTATPKGNNIYNWEVRIFKFDEKSEMYQDLQEYKAKTGRDYVEMSVTFPPTYPFHPPFVRVVQPRFILHTGRITIGGSLCTDVLTMESWSPIYQIEPLMVNIISEIQNGKPRIDFSNPNPYTLEEAKSAYIRVADFHHWKVNDWLPKQ